MAWLLAWPGLYCLCQYSATAQRCMHIGLRRGCPQLAPSGFRVQTQILSASAARLPRRTSVCSRSWGPPAGISPVLKLPRLWRGAVQASKGSPPGVSVA